MTTITLADLLGASADDGTLAALRIITDLEPIGGPGSPVKPAVYEGGRYQRDKRWGSSDDVDATPVIVIDNVPSQANRLEAALRRLVPEMGLPEIILDLGGIPTLPAHLPRDLSSWQFPHRNGDAYLRDSELEGVQFISTDVGRSIIDATAWNAGALVAWFPQALVYGFWQSHLGKKRSNAKLARAWVSEIIGWSPAWAVEDPVRVQGTKGDPLNLNTDEVITSNEDDRQIWEFGKARVDGGKSDKLSEMGHGQVPFRASERRPMANAPVSFGRVTQTATLSFAQLRQVGLGAATETDAAARALVAAIAIAGHVHAFGRGFCLRSGADLVPIKSEVTWVGSDASVTLPTNGEALELVATARVHAEQAGVPLDGWGREPLRLSPRPNLTAAIEATWPLEQEG